MKISTFTEKWNRVDGNVYVVEEAVTLKNGVYEAELQHDNISENTLAVHTGPKLTGERITDVILSTPSNAPWKRIIRFYASVPAAYISYETPGDTVEADDINRVQEAVLSTQEALNTEEARALDEEKKLAAELAEEIGRAQTAEQDLQNALAEENGRAEAAETVNSNAIAAEVSRAVTRENELQSGIQTEISRAEAAENAIRSTIFANKPVWDDKYTRNEVDNKFSALETAIDWKEAVGTYADLSAAYPEPDDGWTVNVRDTDITYRWSGTKWIAISANAIPKATQSVDGLLSKEDKAAYDDASAKKHTHGNKATLDKLTETLLANWTAAHTHISDTVKHITAAERTAWNDTNAKKHSHSNKAVLDKVTQAMLDAWNTVTNKVDKVSGKQLSTNDYTTAEKNKLAGIAAGAKANVQADWNATDSGSDAFIKNKPPKIKRYGVCSTAAATAAKTVSCPNFVLETGAHIRVKFTVTNTVSGMTLNVNGTGAKPIKYHGGTLSNSYLSAKRIIEFVYDGTNWEVLGDLDTNTKYNAFKGATSSAAGGLGLVPAPPAGNQEAFLCGNGTWKKPDFSTNCVPKGPTWNELTGRE